MPASKKAPAIALNFSIYHFSLNGKGLALISSPAPINVYYSAALTVMNGLSCKASKVLCAKVK